MLGAACGLKVQMPLSVATQISSGFPIIRLVVSRIFVTHSDKRIRETETCGSSRSIAVPD